MAKRKPTDYAQMNLRLRESLRKKIEFEAKKNGLSLNSELVRRLERTFVEQGIEAVIQQTALRVAMQIAAPLEGSLKDVADALHDVGVKLNWLERTINLKQGEQHG
jgi:hypothetical protein